MFKKKSDKFSKKSKKAKGKIRIYAIFHNEAEIEEGQHPISFAASYSEAAIAVGRLLFLKYHSHYRLWCENHDLEYGFLTESWARYLTDVVGDAVPEDKYIISEIFYDNEHIAAFLRMFTECDPLILPGDIPEELLDYIHKNNVVTNGLTPHLSSLANSDPALKDIIEAGIETVREESSADRDTHRNNEA